MYKQQEPGQQSWADGQLNENHERTDDLDGAAEGENETRRVIAVQNQTVPSRPRSRDSHYHDRDRDRGEQDYNNTSSRVRSHHAGRDETRRRRTDSFANVDRDRDRMMNQSRGVDEYGYDYNRRPRPSQHDRSMYSDPYYQMGPYNQSRGGYPMQMSTPHNMSSRDYLARLRVEYPVIYREWYTKFQMHKNSPHQVPFPPIPPFPTPGFGPYVVGGPMTHLGAYPTPHYNLPPQPGQQSHHSQPFNGDTSGYDRPNIHSGNNSDNGNGRPSGRSSVVELGGIHSGFNSLHHGYPINRTPSILNYQVDDSSTSLADYNPPGTETPPPRRMTPPKFNISHCIGNLTPLGKLLRIKGGGSTIEIIDIKPLMKHLPEFKEVEVFPGPLIKGTTHKNNVIQFCQRKIREAQLNEAQVDQENFILLWEYLILLLRQNGNVVGTDIAELLLKNTSSVESADVVSSDDNDAEQKKDEVEGEEESSEEKPLALNKIPPINEEKITEKFCELLLYGHKKDALEYAMNNALWGHAILLSSKMDDRTYGHVMARFANCTPYNHPLQTLYQVMSGKQPSSVTSCCDDSFGDWRPHLAMILSNAGCKLDVEVKAVITLGDTLASKNHVYAAQFCHLMGEVEFSFNSKLGPLLGLNASAGNTVEAIQMTEILEFARSLSQSNTTLGPSFIQSKLSYTKTLLDYGFVQEAYAYCEEMAKNLQFIKKTSNEVDIDLLRWSILQIAERLVKCENTDSTEEPVWIQQLRVNRHTSRTESISDNSSERRDSLPDTTSVGEKHDVHEQNHHTESLSSELKNFHSGEPYTQHVALEPQNIMPTSYDQQSQFSSNQEQVQPPNMMSNQHVHTMPDVMNVQQFHSYNQQQPPPAMPDPYMGQHHSQQQQQQPSYDSMQQQSEHYQQPSYMNYQPPDGEFDMTNQQQQPPLSDGSSMGMNKKKSVRFEDDGKTEDSYKNTEIEISHRATTLLNEDNVENEERTEPVRRKNYSGYKSAFKVKNDQLNYESNSQDLGSVRSGMDGSPLSSDEIMEEIDRLTFSTYGRKSVNSSAFKGTFPIDEPISSNPQLSTSRPSTLRLKKTFPIDKHCCNENEMCEDHDNFYNGSIYSSSSNVSSPNANGSSSNLNSKFPNDSGNMTGAGPNSLNIPRKGLDNMPPPPPTFSNSQQQQFFNPSLQQQPQQHQQPYNHQPAPPNFSNSQQQQFFNPSLQQQPQQQYNHQPVPPQPQQQHKPSPSADNKASGQKKSKDGSKSNKGGGDEKQSSGWITGLFTKLSIKPKNQMFLPDDKDPAIVWNPDLKRWVNTKDAEDETSAPIGPPPSIPDMRQQQQQGVGGGLGGGLGGLPRKRAYVDVLNPNTNNTNNNLAPAPPNRMSNNNNIAAPPNRMSNGGVGGNIAMMNGPPGGAPVIPNMFIPSPVMGSGDSGPISFLTPSPVGPIPPNPSGQPETN